MTGPIRDFTSPVEVLRDLDRLAAGTTARLAASQELGRRAAELAGEARSDDGLIRVVCRPGAPLHELSLDPRAMRMVSADLAEAIQAVAAAARADLDRRTAELTRELFPDGTGALGVTDAESARARMAELSELATGTVTDAQALFDRLTRSLHR